MWNNEKTAHINVQRVDLERALRLLDLYIDRYSVSGHVSESDGIRVDHSDFARIENLKKALSSAE